MTTNLRLLALTLLSWTVAALRPTTLNSVAQKNAGFGVRLFQEILREHKDKNLGFSPYGASSALNILQSGTDGETLKQLQTALNYGYSERTVSRALRKIRHQLNHSNVSGEHATRVNVADGLFVQRDLDLTPGFLRRFHATFKRHVAQINFADPTQAKDILNQWVENQTDGMIKDLLGSKTIPPLTRLVLLNAVSFNGKWVLPFPEKATHSRPFYRSDGSEVQTQMMANTGKYNCSEFETPDGEYYDVIELPYEGGELSMLIAAPYEKNVPLSAITDILTPELINQWKANMQKSTRLLVLPKFSLVSEVNLKTPLENLGIEDMFSEEKADFSQLSNERPLYVSEAFQKIKVEVTESGTRAAAATAVVLLARMAPLEVIMDHPFLFLIRHNPTGTLLFMGQVMEP
ncbi:PREDICTED: plasminogen activator inhibitor 1 [Nanorana parkeri]|uniref:plasminogen activator inhibitor 1 n=1 Tax=Nanorana parkeri TaxID=125878 RepID=UPI0008541C5C|nr:PREDICTED: plasminogen activator inhibitor 1 [Nanorana parkeri]